MFALLPAVWDVLLNLPHPLEFAWLIWLIVLPSQLRYLFRRNSQAHQLSKTGELMNFREISAIGCVGGFILLTFIFALCTWYTLSLNNVI